LQQYYAPITDSNITQDARLAPFYFLYGGRIDTGLLDNLGNREWYWSSTAVSHNDAYQLHFSPTNIYPSEDSRRFYGYSIRCLAR